MGNLSLAFVFFFLICAATRAEPFEKIVGGVEARIAEFPWIVAITTPREFCAGSLISPSVVLTAAHCGLHVPSRYTVRAGVHNLKYRSAYDQTSTVKNISIFPQYNPRNGRHDIAIFHLSDSFKFNYYVFPIELPDENFLAEGDAFVAGWGVKSESGKKQPDIMQTARIPIIPNDVCKVFYDSDENETPINVYESTICAGGNGKSACFGDSGGPLMCESLESRSDGLVCCGMISAGAKCGKTGVFTKVSYYRKWIQYVTGI